MDIDTLREMAQTLPLIIRDLERVQELYQELDLASFPLIDRAVVANDELTRAIQQVETLRYKTH